MASAATIPAGSLRGRLTFKVYDRSVRNEYGEPSEDATTQVTVWGEVTPLTGRELVYAQQIQAEITHRIRIRYRADVGVDQIIGPGSQLEYRGRTLEIATGPRNVGERNVLIEMMAKEVA